MSAGGGEYRAGLGRVGQLPQQPERMMGAPVLSTIRLRCLDKGEKLALGGEPGQRPVSFAAPRRHYNLVEKVLLLGLKRKARFEAGIRNCASNKMFQRTPQAMDVIPTGNTYGDRRFGLNFYADAIAASLVIGVSPVGVGFSIEESAGL